MTCWARRMPCPRRQRQEGRQHLRYAERQRSSAVTVTNERRNPRCGLDRQLGRHDSASLVAAVLRLARLDRPIGSWLLLMPCWWSAALAAASRTNLTAAARHRAVLRRRLRHAGRRLHLERHHRPRSRREGRADTLAADSRRPGERHAGAGLPDRAGPDRACRAAAIQPLRGLDRHRLAFDRGDLSLHEAHHLVAADRARPRLLLGRADGICRDLRPARCDGDRSLCRIDLPG